MIVKYVSGNSRKEFILNQNYEISIKTCNPYQSNWTYEFVKRQYGIDISRFGKDPINLKIALKFRGTKLTINQNLENFYKECEKDIIGMTPGKIWIGDHYLQGYVISRTTTNVSEFYGRKQELSFLGIKGFWIKEEKRSFYAASADPGGDTDLDYNYDYNYDYAAEAGSGKQWYVDHFASSEFKMIIYGSAVDPRININGYPYQIFDDIETGEYVLIDSQNNTVTKYRNNGTTVNLFDMRAKEQSVFQPIPGGLNSVSWSGAFGFDIILFTERSEPKW